MGSEASTLVVPGRIHLSDIIRHLATVAEHEACVQNLQEWEIDKLIECAKKMKQHRKALTKRQVALMRKQDKKGK